MKVLSNINVVQFKSLPTGSVFMRITDGRYYMKTVEFFGGSGRIINIVRLEDGILDRVSDVADVILINGKFVQET